MKPSRMLMFGTAAALLLGIGTGAGYWLAMQAPGHAAGEPVAGTGEPGAGAGGKVLYWYDPMQPQLHFDKPGKSPFMDMPLVAKYADSAAGGAAEGAGVRIDAALIQNTGIRTAEVTRGRLEETVEASGALVYNERDVTVVQARTGGIVERVYARATNDWVEQGAPLADVRVPEWYGAQAEFLALRRGADGPLAAAARDRLIQMGMSAELVAEVERTAAPQPIITVRFSQRGVLQELGVRRGMTVMPGQTLAKVNGLATVWLEADVPEAQSAGIGVGHPVTAVFAAWPGRPYAGRVTALLPEVNREARTVRVRAELANPGRTLRPGMFARVRIGGPAAREALLVPSEAVISTGTRTVIIVPEAGGRFRPVQVRIGRERDGKTEILGGLRPGERVVTSGQFLIDSEASLRGVLARMESSPAHEGHSSAPVYEAVGTIQELTGREVSVAHGPIPALQWGAMTMEFQLKDARLGTGFRPGDSVRFAFTRQGDEFVVERLEKAEARP
jgi:Cu(I)/Ag(I) efflux system membrane fusion protein